MGNAAQTNQTYHQQMIAHESWMALSRRQSAEFLEDMRIMDIELAKVEAFLDEED